MAQRLATDILLEIFAFNTGTIPLVLSNYYSSLKDTIDLVDRERLREAREATPLATTRLSSQVCRSWRDLILNTPTLWGLSMDFDQFRRAKSCLWATEVYRRGGQSIMSVKAIFCDQYSDELRALLLRIFNQDWPRVKFLELRTSDERHINFMLQIWKVLATPAPQLVGFKLLGLGGRLVGLPTNFLLFANEAPSLQLLYAPEILFSLRSSILSNLTHFGISKGFEVEDILSTLSCMPSLKSVILHNILPLITQDRFSSLPKIVLPHLNFLDVMGRLEECLVLLDRIKYPMQCLLNIRCDNRNISTSNTQRNGLHDFYKGYLDGYLQFHPVKSLSINIRTNKTMIRLHLNVLRYGHNPGPQLSFISTSDSIIFDLETILSTYLSTLSERNSYASRVTSLFLHWNLKSINSFSTSSITSLAYFPSAFISLSKLTIDPPSLDLLLDLSKRYQELFPSLSVLEIVGIGTTEPLSGFLDWRMEIGRPIQTLDPTACFSWTFNKEDTTYWDSHPGMKLMYREYNHSRRESVLKEYTCGSGTIVR